MIFRKISIFMVGLLAIIMMASCDEKTPTNTELEGVLSYSEYVATSDGEEVTIAGYVQGKQSWWDNKATVYLQDDNGGYFLYELPCTQEQYNTDLAIGKRIKVTGLKGSWSGMVEILGSEEGAEATYEPLEGTKIYDAKPQTGLENDKLIALSSQKVSFAELTVVSVQLPTSDGGDIYFDVTDGKNILTFCIEAYLTDANTSCYKTALTLEPGDVISCEGFMYVYKTAQLHTTAITKSGVNVLVKSEDAMTYEEYVAQEEGSEVTIEGFVQGKQAWWDNKATVYLQDDNGGYFLYELPCTQEQYNTDLAIGKRIKVTGLKGSWSGMVEILGSEEGAEATFEPLEGVYLAPVKALTLSDDLISYSTQKVSFSGLTVVSVQLPTSDGGDIYFDVTDADETVTLTFCIEAYLTDANTSCYKTALTLEPGDVISCEGFMYVYNTAQLHTTKISLVKADE